MVKKIKSEKGFTTVEILLTLSILGFILLMTTLNVVKQLPDLHKARYKKAYSTVEKTVAALINDDDLYPSLFMGFKYTRPAVTEFGEKIGSDDMSKAPDKFRDAFKYTADAMKDGISCECIGTCENDCFMTDDGVVFGIPNTDFDKFGIEDNAYKANNTESTGKYLPIAVYTDFEKSKKKDTQDKDVMYIGVQYDGNVRIFYPNKCLTSSKEQYCKAEEYMTSDTIKKEK